MIKQLDIFDDLKIFLELKPFSVEQCPVSKSVLTTGKFYINLMKT